MAAAIVVENTSIRIPSVFSSPGTSSRITMGLGLTTLLASTVDLIPIHMFH